MQLNRKGCYARSRSSQCSQEEEQVPFIKGNKSINSYPIHILIPTAVILIFSGEKMLIQHLLGAVGVR